MSDILNTVQAVASSIAAISAAIAAFAAWKSIESSKKTTEAQILLKLRTEFSTQKMHDALKLIGSFKREHGGKFVERFRALKGEENDEFNALNNARRIVKGYFLNVCYLHQSGAINRESVLVLISKDSFDLILETLEPMERVILVSVPNNVLWDWASDIR